MKVTITEYNGLTENYKAVTNKGRVVYVDPFINDDGISTEDKEKLVGKFYKLRNDSEVLKGDPDIYLPTCYQWYELDKITGKKLKSITIPEL